MTERVHYSQTFSIRPGRPGIALGNPVKVLAEPRNDTGVPIVVMWADRLGRHYAAIGVLDESEQRLWSCTGSRLQSVPWDRLAARIGEAEVWLATQWVHP